MPRIFNPDAFIINSNKSDTVSSKLQRLVRIMQFEPPQAVILQEVASLQRELKDPSEVITIRVTVESKKTGKS